MPEKINSTTIQSITKLLSPRVSVQVEADIGGYHGTTQPKTDNSTLLATTAYVKNNLADYYDKDTIDGKILEIDTTLDDSYDTSLEVDTKILEVVPKNVGSGVKPVYTNNLGTIVASNSDVGNTTTPVYMDKGEIKPIGYTIAKSVPADALFTDTVYVHPTTSGNKHIPSGGSAGNILLWKADGEAQWGSDINTHYTANLIVGNSNTSTSNSTTDNDTTFVNTVENGTKSGSIQIKGDGATTVTATNGIITITSVDTVYTHPTTAGNKHIPSGGSEGKFLKWSSSGTAVWADDNNTITTVTVTGDGNAITNITDSNGALTATKGATFSLSTHNHDSAYTALAKNVGSNNIPVYTDADGVLTASTFTINKSVPADAKFTDTTYDVFVKSGSNAATGLVPKPPTTAGTTKYLREDGNWITPPNDNTVTTVTVTGDGNAITNITDSNGVLTATKGITFSPSDHNHDIKYALRVMSVGSGVIPVYTDASGVITASTSSVGNTNKPVYMDAGQFKPISFEINADVPADAKFTDTVYTHPTGAGNKHIPSGGSEGQFLKWSSSGTAVWADDNDTVTTVSVTGSGNAITNITDSNGALTATKGATFSLSTHNHDNRYTPITDGVGSATQGVYTDSNGEIQAMTYELNKTVPSDAVFTDTVYTHPTTSGNKHIPSGGSSGKFLKWKSDGEAEWANDNDTTYVDFIKSGSNAASGLVPKPPTTAGTTKYLREDGNWETPPNDNTVYTHPDGTGYRHIPTGGSSGQFLKWKSDGEAEWANDNNTTYSDFVGSGTNAAHGLVPKPPTTAGTSKYLREDGTWETPPNDDTIYTHPTTSGNKHIPSGGSSGQFLKWSADGTAVWANDNNTVTTVSVTGSGNAITNIIDSNGALTATKGSSFSLSTHDHDSTYSQLGHTHNSSEITSMTSYEKPSSSSAISTSDSLNDAIGKLEKALDEKQASGSYLTTTGTAADSSKLGGVAAANYAKLASPAFTGTPTAPTAAAGTNSTQIATTAYVDGAVSSLVNSAPETLDTLNELATALGNDPNFATTVANDIGAKLDTNSANYVKSLSISGITITVTKGNDSTSTLTTQDTTYSDFVGSGTNAAHGLVPKPSTTAGTSKYLREDGIWETPPNDNTVTTVTVSGSGNAITNITASNGALTATKGSSFSLSTHNHDSDYTPKTSGIGSATQGVYTDSNGEIQAMTYELNKTVPSDAVFTDTVYTHPTTSGNKHIPSGGSSGQFLKWSADGTAVWAADNDTTYSDFIGSGSTAAAGLVPKPPTTAGTSKYLREDGTWETPPNDNTVYTHPTTSGNKHIPSGGSSGKFLKWKSDGEAEWANDNNTVTTVSVTGDGNAITNITDSNGALTATKGATFSLSTHNHDSVYTPITEGVGSTTQGVYTDSNGEIQAMTYELNKTVPADAKFTDTVYTHPTTSGNKHIPSGGSSGKFLKWKSDGEAEWANDNNTVTTVSVTGSGNAITNITASDGALTATKGFSFSLSNHNHDSSYTPLTTGIGSATQGVYTDSNGEIQAMTYELNKTVPSDAVFTDTVYTHPTTSGNKHIPSGGSSGQFLKWSADGTATWAADNNTVTTIASASGSGNAITSLSATNGVITPTLGKTFSESTHTHSDYAPKASPALTGTPTAPTAAAGTNTTQIATTAFVQNATTNVKHSYTTAANAAKDWYTIANANTHQIDTTKPLHTQFMLRAYNTNAGVGYYQEWFVDLEVFGQNSGIRVFGNAATPFSSVRVLYENTAADVTTSTAPIIDIYLNYVLTTATNIEIEEIYNSGFTFVANGALSATTVPSGYENRSQGVYANGIVYCNTADYSNYSKINYKDVSANTTLAVNDTWAKKILNCTGTITLTIPTGNANTAWFWIKNNGTGVITLHPASTSVYFDNVSEDITLQPKESLMLACQSSGHYSIMNDSRIIASTTSAGSLTQPIYFNNGVPTATTYALNKTVPADAVFTDTVYTHPTTSGNKHIPSGGSSGQFLKWSADGTAVWAADNNTTYSNFVKSGSTAAAGLVPAPPTTAGTTKYLREDGTWTVPPNDNTVYTHPTTSGNKHIPSGGSSGQFLKWSADGTAVWAADNDTTYTIGTASGSGNAITSLAISGSTITPTLGSTFSLSNHNHDSTYLKLTGGTITGGIIFKSSNLTRGTAPSANSERPIVDFKDSADNRLGYISNIYKTDMSSETIMYAYKTTTATGNNIGSICIGCDSSGNIYTRAPTPATADNSTKIATTAYVKAQGYTTASGHNHDSTYLKLAGGTVTGTLTMSADHGSMGKSIVITGAKQNYAIQIQATDITKGTAPSATINSAIDFYGATMSKYQNRLANLENTVTTGNVNTMAMRAYNLTSAENTGNCTISCNVDASGNVYTSAPTPATADNSTKIATTAFVKAQSYITASSNITGTAANVSGTVAIANGGTGATTRLNALKALTNENVGTSSTYFLTITDSWGKGGYCSVANAKTVLGLGSAAYTASTAYAAASHTHSYLPLSGGTITGGIKRATTCDTWVNGCKDGYGIGNLTNTSGFNAIINGYTKSNKWAIASYPGSDELVYLYSVTKANVTAGSNTLLKSLSWNTSNGTLTADKVVGAYYADYAEYFPKGEETEPGDVIVLDDDNEEEKYIKSTANKKLVVGVHSDNYSHIIGGETPPVGVDFRDYNEPNYIPVALCGRIATKFVGPAKRGAYVVPSEIDGVARAYNKLTDDPLTVFGILVEEDDNNGNENNYYVRRLKVKLKC